MRNLFTRVSGGYDKVNRALSLGLDVLWRGNALRLLSLEGVASGAKILDLAAGTGDFSVQAAKTFRDSPVTAVDITPAMMEIGKLKTAKAGLSGRISFVEGNAMDLRFADKSFDCVTCAFGFRNFPSAEKSLSEVSRVLKDGGKLAVLEFFRPPTPFAAKLLEMWIGAVSRIFARRHVKEYRYLGSSIRNMRTEESFVSLAKRENLELVRRRFRFPCCSCLIFGKVS